MDSQFQNGYLTDQNRKYSAVGKSSSNDSLSSTGTATPSETWYDDQDLVFHSNPDDNQKRASSSNVLNNLDSSFVIDESELKSKEIDLYNDLITIENEEKRSKEIQKSEIEKLRKEIQRLKQENGNLREENARISTEISNLKKNVCSLYKTAKAEIDRTKNLLAEANRKLDNRFQQNAQSFENNRYESHPKYYEQRIQSNAETANTRWPDDWKSSKQRRYDDSRSSSYTDKPYESAKRRPRFSSREPPAYRHSSKVQESKPIPRVDNLDKAWKSSFMHSPNHETTSSYADKTFVSDVRRSELSRCKEPISQSQSSKIQETKSIYRVDNHDRACTSNEKSFKHSRAHKNTPYYADKTFEYEKRYKFSRSREPTPQSHSSVIQESKLIQRVDNLDKASKSSEKSSRHSRSYENAPQSQYSKMRESKI